MEQRSLRLGDIVDDYCPRERRVTNHAIVAVVGDSIKQTRCTTCEAEHEYKEARTPRRKGKNGEASDLPLGVLVAPKPASNGQAHDVTVEVVDVVEVVEPADGGNGGAPEHADADGNGESRDERVPDGWLAHRPLIRATLPKTEADPPPARPIPEFTMHQRQGRGFGGGGGRGGYRQGFSGYGGNGQGGGGNVPRDANGQPDGNRAPRPGGGKSRHRRRHRRPR